MKLNLTKRFQNKAFCLAFAGACLLLLNQLGLGQYMPSNILDIVNSLLTILCMLGIVTDPTTEGINDSELALSDNNSQDLLIENAKLREELEELNKEIKNTNEGE